jgi:16S rRNA (uracil1498-N3)-methyltransferase
LTSDDPLEVFDGLGQARPAAVVSASPKHVAVRFTGPVRRSPTPFPLLLALAVPKGPAMETAVRQATEIGATRILPLLTEHGVVRLDDPARRREKWQRLALEACKQCGRDWLPRVEPPVRLDALARHAASPDSSDLRLVAALSPLARPLADCAALAAPPSSASLVIGPEGDFSPAELESLLQAGYRPLWLGPHILRVDTAVAYGLAILSQRFLGS